MTIVEQRFFNAPENRNHRVNTGFHPAQDVAIRTRTRVTRRLVPYLMFIYMLAYLDRANISVAKLGMRTDLGFNDAIIGFGAGVFFLGYLLLNIPATLIVERWSARKLIAQIMITWGLVASAMGFLGTPLFGSMRLTTQFYALRLLLGSPRRASSPASSFISRTGTGLKTARAPKATSWSRNRSQSPPESRLSGWILDNIHWAGLRRLALDIHPRGRPPPLMGLVTLCYLTDRPAQANWLPDDEKQWLLAQLQADDALKISITA